MLIALMLLILLGAVGLLFWQVSNIISSALGAPAVASPKHNFLKEFANKEKTILDLGCAGGNVVIAASPMFKHVYGIEASPFYYLLAKWRARKLKNVTIIYGNFFNTEWPQTDYIYCYLLPSVLEKLAPKLKQQHATTLSFGFAINGWEPKRIIEKSSQKLFVYKK